MRILSFILIFLACTLPGRTQHPTFGSGEKKIHKVVIKEVLQTSMYTYLQVKEDDILQWIAIPKMEAKVGDTCYHLGGMLMKDFKSKELDRLFPAVYFMDFVSMTPEGVVKSDMPSHEGKPQPGKKQIRIDVPPGGITLAELFRNRESYAGKVVRIGVQVVKFNDKIMGRNWAHVQDGTAFGDEFDLTVTLDAPLTVGDVVVLEGKISLDKDFGSGYFFKVIMESASILE